MTNVNTKNTFPTVNTFNADSITLTNPQTAVTDGDMKDKWLQVRVDEEIEAVLDELRIADLQSGKSKKLPNKSQMVLLLIERAHEQLKKGKKQ